eukprot:s271_g8.t1
MVQNLKEREKERLQEDKYSWAHIATALIMVACSAVMFVSGDLLACLKAPAATDQKTVDEAEEADEEGGAADARGTQMLPAEEKSDQPVRWFTKALRKGKLSADCGCLTLRFENEYTEKVWILDSLPKNMQRGAALMAGMAIGLLMNRTFYFYEYFTCEELHHHDYEQIYSLNVDLCFSLCLLVVMSASLLLTWALGDSKPRQELSTAHLASYWCLMLFLWGAFLATTVPPLKMTCEQLEDVGGIRSGTMGICDTVFHTPALKLDCTLQGHTACQIFMLFLLALPFALPQLYHQYLALVWLLIYGGATYAYGTLNHLGPEAEKRQNKDMMLHLSLLILALGIGYSRKFSLEKSMRKQFVGQLRQRQTMAPLYLMFKEMVPEYVIPRMLNKEVIADPRSTVTVLFVLIDNFGEYTREKQDPQSSLKFLNACFDKMDTICAKYKVTKIETVQEEYVACVGVTMEEQSIDHKVLLSKLLKAAAEILAVKEVEVEGGQKVAVSFKMGMHTGSIVAGVIGSKLPRFRLFGDTINTSARMMQKGQPGTVQFGEATMKYVDADKVVDNSTRPNNGIVTMKGKGDVQTWVLNTKAAAEEGGVKPDEKRKSALSQMVMGKAVEESHDDEFDQMMDKQLAEDESEFSAKEEAEWLCWFHENNMGTFALRMNFLTFVFSCVTLIEVFHMEHIRAFDESSNRNDEKGAMKHDVLGKVPPKWRLFLFLFFRFAAFLICLVWSILANSGSEWLRPPVLDFRKLVRRQWEEAGRQRRQVQVALVLSKAIICILVWLSYNVLILERRHQAYSKMHRLDYYNQQFSLVFMMAFFVIINGQVVLGFSSLTFVLLAIGFMAIEERTTLYVSMTGRVVFVGVAILGSILAYEGERSSRASFRSKVKVEKTESRIEDVLTTLMPKEVLKEWRDLAATRGANPGTHPVHVYKHATVTQSDLCGFTQLSSGRSPFEVVSFMGELFGRFDVLAQEFNIYKVETVGDAYIAGMAEPYLTDQHSAVRVVEFGLAMIKATAKWSERLRQRGEDYKDANVRCRVGVHHGECVGGIVGTGMMRYHLFGEFMSIVDILEATSKEGVCQISDACRKQIESEGGFSNSIQFEERKDELKTSKGEVHGTDEVGGTTFLVYPVITEDRVRNLEEGSSELQKKVRDLELRTCLGLGCHDVRSSL